MTASCKVKPERGMLSFTRPQRGAPLFFDGSDD